MQLQGLTDKFGHLLYLDHSYTQLINIWNRCFAKLSPTPRFSFLWQIKIFFDEIINLPEEAINYLWPTNVQLQPILLFSDLVFNWHFSKLQVC